MASQRGRALPGVIEQLFADASQFDFFQAVRLLEHQRRPTGYDHVPDQEAVRFGVHQTLSFPVSDVASLAQGKIGEKARLGRRKWRSTSWGSRGPTGVLPQH